MEISRSLLGRQERAHVLRDKRRTILRASTNLHDPQFSYDPSVPGSESSGDGKRVAERYLYKQKKTDQKKETIPYAVDCPSDCVPETWLPIIKDFFAATDKRLLVIGRIGLRSPQRKKYKPRTKVRNKFKFYVITQNMHTGRYICGIVLIGNYKHAYSNDKIYIKFTTTMDSDPEQNIMTRYALHGFFDKYYALFKLTFPEYTGVVTAPPFLLEPLIEIRNE